MSPYKSLTRVTAILVMVASICAAQRGRSLPTTSAGPDPLGVGKAELDHNDFKSAKSFFEAVLQQRPGDLEALHGLGRANLGLGNFVAAIKNFQEIIARKKDAWPVHQDLARAYAESQDWQGFLTERAVIKAARERGEPGLEKDGDVIDMLHLGDKTYTVRAFDKPYGPHHTHYAFLHYGEANKLLDFFECDSDDPDQVAFRQEHPKEAEAGVRRFSLDLFTAEPVGFKHQPVIVLFDGEPTYEHLRTDVMLVLEGKAPVPTVLSPSAK